MDKSVEKVAPEAIAGQTQGSNSEVVTALELLESEQELYEEARAQQEGEWGEESICTYNMYLSLRYLVLSSFSSQLRNQYYPLQFSHVIVFQRLYANCTVGIFRRMCTPA